MFNLFKASVPTPVTETSPVIVENLKSLRYENQHLIEVINNLQERIFNLESVVYGDIRAKEV